MSASNSRIRWPRIYPHHLNRIQLSGSEQDFIQVVHEQRQTPNVHERRHSSECQRSTTLAATSTTCDPPTHPECAYHAATTTATHACLSLLFDGSHASGPTSSLYDSRQLRCFIQTHLLRFPRQFLQRVTLHSQVVRTWTAALILRVVAVCVDRRDLLVHNYPLSWLIGKNVGSCIADAQPQIHRPQEPAWVITSP